MKNKWLVGISILLVILVLSGLSGCAPSGARARGWSGATVVGDTLFIGNMTGQLVKLDLTNGTAQKTNIGSPPASGGGFGCGAPSTTVAIYGTPAASNGLVYIGSYATTGNDSSGRIYAFPMGGGEAQWVYPRDTFLPAPIIGGLVVANNKVYFGAADNRVYALDAATGNPIANFVTGDKIWSTPVIQDNVVYIGSLDKKLYALDAEKLTLTKWEYFQTTGAIVASPLISEDTIYVGSFDRYMYAVDLATGQEKWKALTDNWFWAKPIIYENILYAPNLNGRVYIWNAETGNEVTAPINLDSAISSSPVLVGDKVVIATEDGKIYVLDTASKQVNQVADLQQKVYASLTAKDTIIFAHTEQDSIFSVDISSGAVRQYFN